MMGVGREFLSCLLGAFVVAQETALAQPAAPAPDANLTLSARSAGVGIGFFWGAGTLEYGGERYPVRIDGLGAGAGFSTMTAHGAVYHLKEVADLNGQYSALGGGAVAGRGRSRLRMRNAKGVVVDLVAEGTGVQIGMGPRGVTLQVGA